MTQERLVIREDIIIRLNTLAWWRCKLMSLRNVVVVVCIYLVIYVLFAKILCCMFFWVPVSLAGQRGSSYDMGASALLCSKDDVMEHTWRLYVRILGVFSWVILLIVLLIQGLYHFCNVWSHLHVGFFQLATFTCRTVGRMHLVCRVVQATCGSYFTNWGI